MIQNAKDYNERKSEIVEDAERIRKAISNFMPRFNPRYKDRSTRPGATPASRTLSSSKSIPKAAKTRDIDIDSENKPKSLKLRLTNKRALSLTPTVDDSSSSAFVNDDLQCAQERILEEVIQLKDAK